MKRARWICVVLLAAGDIGAAALVLPRLWNCGLLDAVRGGGWAGALVYAAVYGVTTVLMIPPAILNAAAGAMFGAFKGMLVVYPALVGGGMVSFWLSRSMAREWVGRRIVGRAKFLALDRAVARGGLKMVLLLRMSPVSPFALLSYSLGLTRVRVRDYFLGTLLGGVPGTAVYVYAGSAVGRLSGPAGAVERLVFWVGLAATAAGVVLISRLARQELRKAMSEPAVAVSPCTEGQGPAAAGVLSAG